jgi:hypothetical protein
LYLKWIAGKSIPLMKNKLIVFSAAAALFFTSCSKTVENVVKDIQNKETTVTAPVNEYVMYTIKQGEQYCDKNGYTPVKYSELKFKVKFDSSAIYTTIEAGNQKDINKLFGFSDNNAQHHQFSARFGWRWSDNALRLFAYTYNDSKRSMKEIGTVELGAESDCSIKINGDKYIFTLNDKQLEMPRTSTAAIAEGYKLYPYFGGNEMAPRTISIWIKEL